MVLEIHYYFLSDRTDFPFFKKALLLNIKDSPILENSSIYIFSLFAGLELFLSFLFSNVYIRKKIFDFVLSVKPVCQHNYCKIFYLH